MFLSFILSTGLLSAAHDGHYHDYLSYNQDSLSVVEQFLPEATVTADKGLIVTRTDTLLAADILDVSEVLVSCPGLTVNDNGGLSGLKTVSLRGMGSAHTAVYIDGLKVANLQSGQQDLGMMDPMSVGKLVVDYAQNSISMNTPRPEFDRLPIAAHVRMYGGSFGTWLPSARVDFRLSDNYSLSATASGAFTKGDFKCPDGNLRANNDLAQARAGLDLWGLLSGGDVHLKAYYNDASRGTPGSVSWPSDDRQHDRNAFLQGLLRKRFSPLYSLNVSAKGAYDDIFYTSSYGDSRYGQTDVQVNSSHRFDLTENWMVSAAVNLQWDALSSTSYSAVRTSVFTSAGASYRSKIFAANLALEYSGAFDRDALGRHSWSPSADLRVRLFKGLDAVMFARRAYRVPAFNELYYVGYGNPSLRPEDAWLSDVGLEYSCALVEGLRLGGKLNGFYNFIKDKIISAPTAEDPNIWAPDNIGRVRSTGMDAAASIDYTKGTFYCHASVKYSFLSSIDKESGAQVHYTARHVACARADVSWKRWSVNAQWQMRAARSDSYGRMPDWNTLDMSASKSFSLAGAGELSLKFFVRNLLDCRYETVTGYPMPGRSFMGGIEYKF